MSCLTDLHVISHLSTVFDACMVGYTVDGGVRGVVPAGVLVRGGGADAGDARHADVPHGVPRRRSHRRLRALLARPRALQPRRHPHLHRLRLPPVAQGTHCLALVRPSMDG